MFERRSSLPGGVAAIVVIASMAVSVFVSVAAQSNAAAEVTFHRDVAPILQKNCQSCHRPGQTAPMSLLTYETTRPWARSIKAKVAARQMPPWYADPQYGRFANDRRLQERDIETIVRWVDAGAPAGDPQDAPPAVQWPADGWDITPDVIVHAPEYEVPASGVVEWTNVTVRSPFKEDTWITSIEARPSDVSLTHHICVAFKPRSADSVYGVFEWDDKQRNAEGLAPPRFKNQPRPPSRKTQRTGSTNESCYLPGFAAFDYRPFKAAKLIGPNTDIVFELHYTPNGREAVDVAKVGFTVAKGRPERRMLTYALGSPSDADSFAIPPHDGNWKSPPIDVTFVEDAELVWMMPHMHVRGKDMTFRLDFPDGRSEVVLHVPKYDFNWQLGYNPAAPITLPKGTKVHVDAHFDNSSRNRHNPNPNQTVYYGDMTWEEMMGAFLSVTVDMSVDPKKVLDKRATTEGGG